MKLCTCSPSDGRALHSPFLQLPYVEDRLFPVIAPWLRT